MGLMARGIAASVGSAVSLPVGTLSHLPHPQSNGYGDSRPDRECHLSDRETSEQSEEEFRDFPDQTIFDLYHQP